MDMVSKELFKPHSRKPEFVAFLTRIATKEAPNKSHMGRFVFPAMRTTGE